MIYSVYIFVSEYANIDLIVVWCATRPNRIDGTDYEILLAIGSCLHTLVGILPFETGAQGSTYSPICSIFNDD